MKYYWASKYLITKRLYCFNILNVKSITKNKMHSYRSTRIASVWKQLSMQVGEGFKVVVKLIRDDYFFLGIFSIIIIILSIN